MASPPVLSVLKGLLKEQSTKFEVFLGW